MLACFADSEAFPNPIDRRAFDRGAYHKARGHQQGRRAPQPGDLGRSRGEAREALTASERTQSNEAAPGGTPGARPGARAAPGRPRPGSGLPLSPLLPTPARSPCRRSSTATAIIDRDGDHRPRRRSSTATAIIDRAASSPSLAPTSASATRAWPTETYVALLRARLGFLSLRGRMA